MADGRLFGHTVRFFEHRPPVRQGGANGARDCRLVKARQTCLRPPLIFGYDERIVAAVSRISVERIARCPFSVAHDYATDFLRDAERAIDVRVPLRDFFYGMRGHVRKPVRLVFALHPDDTEDGRVHDAMLVEWRAGTRLFPDFHGTLRLRIASVDSTRLTFEGAYRVPLGRFGRMFDLIAGRRIATSTMRDLLDRIAEALEAREAAFLGQIRAGRSGITA